MKILTLSANPKDTERLRLDEEIRRIEEALIRSKNRHKFSIAKKGAVRLKDLRRAMLDFVPNIVHFCGHGNEEGIMIEDDSGNQKLANSIALSGLFELFKENLECVFLNSCFSKVQGKAISKNIHYVIGMSEEIDDKLAIEFAVSFYDALSSGKSFEESFKFGCNAIQFYELPNHLIPVMFKNEGQLSNSFMKNNTGMEEYGLTFNSEYRELYNLLHSKLFMIKEAYYLETDPSIKFKLKKQIEQTENELCGVIKNF